MPGKNIYLPKDRRFFRVLLEEKKGQFDMNNMTHFPQIWSCLQDEHNELHTINHTILTGTMLFIITI